MQQMTQQRRKVGRTATQLVLLFLCLMYFITYVDRVNIATAAGAIKKEFNLTNTQLGLAFSAFGYAYLLLQIWGGWIADRFGARKTLAISGIIWAGSTALTGFTGGLVSLFFARLLLGIGEGATFPTATRAMANWTPAGKRGWAQGITHAFARLGNAIAPPLVVALMALLTWRGSFVALGLVSLIWVAAWTMYFRDDPKDHSGVSDEEIAMLPSFRTAAHLRKDPVPWGVLGKRMAPVIVVYFCYGWTLWLYLNWLPLFFQNGMKLNLKNSAFFSAGVFLAGVVGDALGGVISDAILHRTGNVVRARSHLVCATLVLSLVCLVPVLFMTNLVAIALMLSLAFFFLEISIGPMWAIPMDIAPQFSGTASGLMNTGSALAAIVSPLAFGFVIDKTGNWTLPFIGSICLLGFGAILSFTMHPERTLATMAQDAKDKAAGLPPRPAAMGGAAPPR
jgi:MFS family permease